MIFIIIIFTSAITEIDRGLHYTGKHKKCVGIARVFLMHFLYQFSVYRGTSVLGYSQL